MSAALLRRKSQAYENARRKSRRSSVEFVQLTDESSEREKNLKEDTRDLLRFLPDTLIQQLQRKTSEKWREGKEPIAAAFLFVDIFGMHYLSEALPNAQSTGGPLYTEQRRQSILDALVACFDRLLEITREHGGACDARDTRAHSRCAMPRAASNVMLRSPVLRERCCHAPP
jgi:post-segregation antitoxin (ccd killing protein)